MRDRSFEILAGPLAGAIGGPANIGQGAVNGAKDEYPSGSRLTQMLLVKMLSDAATWADVQGITRALHSVRDRVEAMQRERYGSGAAVGSCASVRLEGDK